MSSEPTFGTEIAEHIEYRIQTAVKAAITLAIQNADAKLIPVVRRSCIACMHFNEQAELCGKFNARPPARVIAFACPEYIEDSNIPFN